MLQKAGIEGSSLKWIQDSLSNRTLFVSLQHGTCSTYPVQHGVPQSVLNPLRFNITLATLPSQILKHTHVMFYVDDICIWTTSYCRGTIRWHLLHALQTTTTYLADCSLLISPSKSLAMAFTCSYRCYPLTLSGSPLEFAIHWHYLGVVVNRDLSWQQRFHALSSCANVLIVVMRCLSATIWDPSCCDLIHIYSALILGAKCYSFPILHGPSPRTTKAYSVLAEACANPATILSDMETIHAWICYRDAHFHHYLRSIRWSHPSSSFVVSHL